MVERLSSGVNSKLCLKQSAPVVRPGRDTTGDFRSSVI